MKIFLFWKKLINLSVESIYVTWSTSTFCINETKCVILITWPKNNKVSHYLNIILFNITVNQQGEVEGLHFASITRKYYLLGQYHDLCYCKLFAIVCNVRYMFPV